MESYECLCGKTFSTFRKLTGHQGSCNIYINNKIKNQQILQSTYTIECPACHRKFIDKNSLNAHLAHCKLYKKPKQIRPGTLNTDDYKNIDGTFKCSLCSKIYTNKAQLCGHLSWCNKVKKIKKSQISHKNWTRDKSTLMYKQICQKISNILKQKYKNGEIKKSSGIASTKEKEQQRREKIKSAMKKYGGKRLHSGRGKQGYYKGYWCDSSWELAYVIYNLDHNIKFERYKGYIEYTFENKIHKYYPDFILEDGTVVEIKGYESKQWEAKKNEFVKNHKLIILNKDGIKIYTDYCINKYGKNYTDLYEKMEV